MTFLHKHMYQVTLLWLYLRISRDFVSRKYNLTAIFHHASLNKPENKKKHPLKSRGVSLMLLQKLLNNLIDKLSVRTPFNLRHESAHYFTHLGF
ncbi:hypothetical protein PaelaDRAFT_2234 [Paenibacillus lactis 154]|uniref:Integrase family protein n=1 Tax=Paenibacillus lactis 154 TaxID=743719 RepID=G4HE23_9BACL|nr:hypothetical protein PaelaDRAFT_2234 [Paenibacillus lactis 154]